MSEQSTTGPARVVEADGDKSITVAPEALDPKLCHEIHTSERKSYRGCRRRWNWITRERWYPKITAKPLEFGVAYHKAMEIFYEPSTWHTHDVETRTQLAMVEFVKVCEKQRKAFLEVKDSNFLESDVQEDYDERIALGKGMLEYYCLTISPDVDSNFKPVKVEIRFIVPIKSPDGKTLHCKCNECWDKQCKVWKKDPERMPIYGDDESGIDDFYVEPNWTGLPVVYAGRLDALVEDRNGDYWIYDWKTARAISTSDEFLYLDDQIGSYVWALRMCIGLPVRGFVYHEQKKGFPQPPKRNANIRLGRAFSVAQNQDTDYDTYLTTVQNEDAAAFQQGLYDDFLTWLQEEGPTFYKRYQIHKSDAELESIGKMLYLEAKEMTDPNIAIYPNAGRFGCNFCAFRQPCLGMNAQEDYLYTLETMFEKREHYYIREDASTESKGAE